MEEEDDKKARTNFVRELKVHVEGLYGGEDKPSIENIDREKLIKDFKEKIENFSKNNNISKEILINFVLDMINEVRNVNPGSKEQYNLIEESLYDILLEGQDFEDGTFDL